jgi:hypothetical protein
VNRIIVIMSLQLKSLTEMFQFQVFTAMAFILFADKKVDIAVIEVSYIFYFIQQLVTNFISNNSSDSTAVIALTKRILS